MVPGEGLGTFFEPCAAYFVCHIIGVIVFGLWYYLSFRKPRPTVKATIRKTTISSILVAIICGVCLCIFSNGTVVIENAIAPSIIESGAGNLRLFHRPCSGISRREVSDPDSLFHPAFSSSTWIGALFSALFGEEIPNLFIGLLLVIIPAIITIAVLHKTKKPAEGTTIR